ncbi:hypothetical protein G3H63_01070 [Microbacterium resistens]|uniref:hypothetical protein n=1 Tax=Microbacterium resistens TaxID=156977 RepID=UPI001C5A3FD7|nr:hypothetical protein [Microbacterium resistens]MBW1637678.1 hypothetical protein [Microbacterium resistens]
MTSPTGSHALPPRFSSAPPRTRRRRGVRALLLTGGALVALSAGIGVHTAAQLGYDDARDGFAAAARGAGVAEESLDAQVRIAQDARDLSLALGDDPAGLVPEDARIEVERIGTDLDASLAEAADARDDATPPPPRKPFWAWEAWGAANVLQDAATAAEEHAGDLRSIEKRLSTTADDLEDRSVAALAVSVDAARAAEAENVSARNEDVIALRNAISDLDRVLADPAVVRVDGPAAFRTLAAEVQDLRASAAAELAEKDGPLSAARLEVEAFARSLAPGVLMDFDWAVLVNGLGVDGWLSGLTWWWYTDGGYATIELSDSIAEQWPSDASRALVAHEVGHAITVRCFSMYDTTDPDATEAWATAWAISMGFHDPANGTSAYGPPPEEMIAAAAACR